MRLLFIELFLLAAISVDAVDSGVITGSIRIAGKIPSLPTYDVEHDVDVCGSQARVAQSLSVGTNQTVRDVIVYLGAATQNGVTNPPSVVLDQRDCEFVPRVQIARSGASLVLKNSDAVLHVVRIDMLHGTNQPSLFLNVATPYAGFEKHIPLANLAGPALLRATGGNGHPWMAAYVAVLPHPWAALTDEKGQFTIRGVPKGAYKMYAWHEVLGTLVRDVKAAADHKTVIDFEFVTGR